MLKYNSLTASEKGMVDREINANFNSSVRVRTAYEKLLHNIHSGISCCNCFRLERNCCCDKIENCFDELDEPDL
jgi:hypothetical protein